MNKKTVEKTKNGHGRGRTWDFLALRPVFTLDEFTEYLKGARKLAQYRLRYYLAEGRISRAANGVYAVVPPGANRESFQPDVYLVGAALRQDAIFSFHSALELHGQAHSTWWECTVCTDSPRSALRVGRYTLRFLRNPLPARQGTSVQMGGSVPPWPGTEWMLRGDRRLCVTTRERTLVDGFREISLAGGLDELVESLDGFSSFSIPDLESLLQMYDSQKLWAAVGWYLERRLSSLYLDSGVLDRFRRRIGKSRAHLVPGQKGAVLVKPWNLMVPEHLARTPMDVDDGP